MSDPTLAGTGRAYGGRLPLERRAERHERLLAAGLQVFGTVGWDDATIGLLCTTAKVGTRAFYEDFDSREALLLEVATGIVLEGVDLIGKAVIAAPPELEAKVRAGLSTYLGFLTVDPRRVRIVYGVVPRAGALTADRHRAAAGFAELIAAGADGLDITPRAQGNRLLPLALTGAAGELLGYWAATTPPPAVEELEEELVALFLAALAP